jgi:hypothetical protein
MSTLNGWVDIRMKAIRVNTWDDGGVNELFYNVLVVGCNDKLIVSIPLILRQSTKELIVKIESIVLESKVVAASIMIPTVRTMRWE